MGGAVGGAVGGACGRAVGEAVEGAGYLGQAGGRSSRRGWWEEQ